MDVIGKVSRWLGGGFKPANSSTVLPRPSSSILSPGFLYSAIESDAGVKVTPETAMAASAVYACVGVIADAMASMPLQVRREADQSVEAGHPIAGLLNKSPNEYMTAADFRVAVMLNLLLWGNGYALIVKDKMQRAKELIPLRAADTKPVLTDSGEIAYRSELNGTAYTFSQADILHIKNASLDGHVGISPIGVASNAVGLAIAMEKFGAKFFSNGGNLGGIVELPAGMKKEAVDAFRESWVRKHSGLDNSLKTAVLTDGMKYHKTATDPEAAQMIDTRLFQVREIARIYRVPLHKIGDLERATFSNIEHQAIEFQQHTIQPWAVKWEQELERKLLLASEADREIRFDLSALLRSDTAARYQTYNVGRTGGWLSVNEIRRKEGMQPIEGGDTYLEPLNMKPAGDASPASTEVTK